MIEVVIDRTIHATIRRFPGAGPGIQDRQRLTGGPHAQRRWGVVILLSGPVGLMLSIILTNLSEPRRLRVVHVSLDVPRRRRPIRVFKWLFPDLLRKLAHAPCHLRKQQHSSNGCEDMFVRWWGWGIAQLASIGNIIIGATIVLDQTFRNTYQKVFILDVKLIT
jgi:hypothetical protein